MRGPCACTWCRNSARLHWRSSRPDTSMWLFRDAIFDVYPRRSNAPVTPITPQDLLVQESEGMQRRRFISAVRPRASDEPSCCDVSAASGGSCIYTGQQEHDP